MDRNWIPWGTGILLALAGVALLPENWERANHRRADRAVQGEAPAHQPGRAGASPESSPEQLLVQAETLNARLKRGEYVSEDEMLALVRQWQGIDPRRAFSFMMEAAADPETHPRFHDFADDIIAQWASRDLPEARAYLQESAGSLQTVRVSTPALMGVYARQDPQGALTWLAEGFPSDSGELRPLAALELARALAPGSYRPAFLAWLATQDIAQSAFSQPAVEETARLLARENPQAALAFASDLPAGTMARGKAIQEALRAWSALDPIAAFTWTTQRIDEVETHAASPLLDAAELDYAISGFALGTQPASMEAARETAQSIQDPSLGAQIRAALQETIHLP